MTTPGEYVLELRAQLTIDPLIQAFDVVEERVWSDRGYVRVRLTLCNGDFVEAAEYFTSDGEQLVTQRYRYQWMDAVRRVLRKRWDNVPHHPDLPTFPDHVHVNDDQHVEPSTPLSIMALLSILANAIITDIP